MARLTGKMRADMRAMEEQTERVNPVRGSGAVPSTGLSQFRGGAYGCGDSSDEEMEGGGFLSDLGIPIVSGLASRIGLGRKRGGMTRRVGAGRKKPDEESMMSGGMNEASQMGLHLGRHLHKLHGAGFWDDFKQGFMSVVSPVAGVAKSLLPLAGPEGMAASGVLGAIGLGKKRGGQSNSDTGAYRGKGKLTITHGAGRESDDRRMLGIGCGTGGMLGQDGHGMRGGRKKRAPAGANDGRRARAEIVKKVMRDRGVKMIEASSIVKREGLY